MDRLTTQSCLLQRMLNNDPVHPGEGVPLKVGGRTIHGTHRVACPFGLVLEDVLPPLVDPGHIGTSNPCT